MTEQTEQNEEMDDDHRREIVANLTALLDKTIRENIGPNFDFALIIHNDEFGMVAGAGDVGNSLERLKHIIDCHNNECECKRSVDIEKIEVTH